MNLLMALYDYLPVVLFCLGGAYLIKDLYNKMYKGVFALLSMGIFTIGSAGFFKAVWKLLYNLGICDFEVLNKCFFPMQTLGFFYMALAMLSPIPKYTSSIPFIKKF